MPVVKKGLEGCKDGGRRAGRGDQVINTADSAVETGPARWDRLQRAAVSLLQQNAGTQATPPARLHRLSAGTPTMHGG
ncbi:hypothetical protein EYF80_052411 [Liparis tanakae]|uniref:Uncharacterized protein n=1 Tax=Liparis tanakae TaxID=230148 RepID=A0A4Z2F979_9TELE|nr:hypothetical protein EYF80_052411 [Liparis tanakae]